MSGRSSSWWHQTRWRWWALALVALFGFRLLFGLSSEFFFEDETQIFLIGLRYHSTGVWPYFGPDVVWTKSEIPGALQGLLVGVPLNLVPVPEAPFVLLNVLSMGALVALAWYIGRRLPSLPKWLVWGWLLTIPWTLQYSTHIINPSYVLPAAAGFFIGFFEAIPLFRVDATPLPLAYGLMGAAITWIMQIHVSWPLLLPYAAMGLFAAWRRRDFGKSALAFVVGAALPASLLIPTFVKYGVSGGGGGIVRNLHLHAVNPWVFVTTLARFLSFASLEINRFLGTDGGKRFTFLERHLWLVPLTACVWVLGLLQPIWMTREWFQRQSSHREWPAMKALVVATVGLVYLSYWFVMEPSQAHAFYIVAPIAFIFAAYCWTFVDSPRWRQGAAIVLGINILFHAGLAWAQAPERSLYKQRPLIAAAIRLRQPEMLGHRRDFAIDGGPLRLADPSHLSDPVHNLTLRSPHYQVGPGTLVRWTFDLENHNPLVAFRDVLYITTYRDAAGHVVDERHEFIKDIFEPGTSRHIEVNDGFLGRTFVGASIRVAAAEALLPAPEAIPEPHLDSAAALP